MRVGGSSLAALLIACWHREVCVVMVVYGCDNSEHPRFDIQDWHTQGRPFQGSEVRMVWTWVQSEVHQIHQATHHVTDEAQDVAKAVNFTNPTELLPSRNDNLSFHTSPLRRQPAKAAQKQRDKIRNLCSLHLSCTSQTTSAKISFSVARFTSGIPHGEQEVRQLG